MQRRDTHAVSLVVLGDAWKETAGRPPSPSPDRASTAHRSGTCSRIPPPPSWHRVATRAVGGGEPSLIFSLILLLGGVEGEEWVGAASDVQWETQTEARRRGGGLALTRKEGRAGLRDISVSLFARLHQTAQRFTEGGRWGRWCVKLFESAAVLHASSPLSPSLCVLVCLYVFAETREPRRSSDKRAKQTKKSQAKNEQKSNDDKENTCTTHSEETPRSREGETRRMQRRTSDYRRNMIKALIKGKPNKQKKACAVEEGKT